MARHYNEMYAGKDMRRAQEHMDSDMIHEDHSKMSNLPSEVIFKEYEKIHEYLPEELDDTEKGIAHQIDGDTTSERQRSHPHRF